MILSMAPRSLPFSPMDFLCDGKPSKVVSGFHSNGKSQVTKKTTKKKSLLQEMLDGCLTNFAELFIIWWLWLSPLAQGYYADKFSCPRVISKYSFLPLLLVLFLMNAYPFNSWFKNLYHPQSDSYWNPEGWFARYWPSASGSDSKH